MEFEGLQRNRKIPSLTPLIDIVFLLLVFFMLTAHFVKDEV
ncbi:MAG: biopolymer transporter ExbD, partial [Gammaproteobacteria bacterium]|nr:biopolymer transporter ExbD [Gammaproteobacteria bacterium]